MTVAPAISLQAPARGRRRKKQHLGNRDAQVEHDRFELHVQPDVREARRADNRSWSGDAGELRCECAEPGCRATVPVVADKHRANRARFIVAPAHVGFDTVVAAADRFFLVEPPLHPGGPS